MRSPIKKPIDYLAIIKRIQSLLNKSEQKYTNQIIEAYTRSYKTIQPHIDKLTLYIEAHPDITQIGIKRSKEYHDLIDITEKELNSFVDYARTTIGIAIEASAILALSSVSQWGMKPVPPSALEVVTRFLQPDTALYERIGLWAGNARQGVIDAIIEGVGLGKNPRVIGSEITKAFGVSLTDAVRTTRTTQLWSARESTRLNYIANGITGWIWMAELDDVTCGACAAMHGTVHDVTEQLDGHWNCVLPDTIVQSIRLPNSLISRWYDGKAIRIETAGGQFLSVTPNHKILTGRGWIEAKFIIPGDNVIRYNGHKRTSILGNPNKNHSPSTIEDIFLAARVNGFISMPSTSEDFHGDGMEGEVNIIISASDLRNEFIPLFDEPFIEDFFISGCLKTGIILPPESHLFNAIRIGRLTPNSIMGSDSISDVILFRSMGHHELIGNSIASAFTIPSDEDMANYSTGNIKDFCERVFGFPSGISGNDLVLGEFIPDVVTVHDWFDYSGHVYNLDTKDGWYISNSIVTHNCRCAMIPITAQEAITQSGEDFFNNLSEEQQDKMLGPGKAQALRDGKFAFSDLAQRVDEPVYGHMTTETPLKDLIDE